MKLSLDNLFQSNTEIREFITSAKGRHIIPKFIVFILICGGLYGFIMGLSHSFLQASVSAIKVPSLFFVTLLICIPTLHFSSLILGSSLKFLQSASILLWGIAVSCTLLAAFSPISFFFLVSNSSYKFMMILHIIIFIVCGGTGIYYIVRNFKFLESQNVVLTYSDKRRSSAILLVWICLYMFVGTQMAYVMSPFVGSETDFILFTGKEHNFYTYIFKYILHIGANIR